MFQIIWVVQEQQSHRLQLVLYNELLSNFSLPTILIFLDSFRQGKNMQTPHRENPGNEPRTFSLRVDNATYWTTVLLVGWSVREIRGNVLDPVKIDKIKMTQMLFTVRLLIRTEPNSSPVWVSP